MLTLIDGNSLLFRAYYGVHSRLTRSDGTPVGAVYGFINMLLPLLASAKSDDSFVCVFDASRKTFRQNIYPEYKANRTATPDDLITQSFMVRDAVSSFGIPVLCIPDVEADDVIATIATQNCNIVDATRIITSDKDLMQLVSHCIFLYDTMKEREIREPQVYEKFMVGPQSVTDVQALMGDSSDNVPGVPGIGPKKAAELINEFGNLDNLYTNLTNIKNERIRTLLETNRQLAYISKRLVTLKTDVNLDGLQINPFVFNTHDAIKYVTDKLESKSLIEKIKKLFPVTNNIFKTESTKIPDNSNCSFDFLPTHTDSKPLTKIDFNPGYQLITNIDDLKHFLNNVTNIIAIDTETTGLNQTADKLVGISLATDSTNGAYIPLRHKKNTNSLFETETYIENQLDISKVYNILWPILTDTNILKIGHNLKFDFHIFDNEGWDISKIQPIDDTMLLSYALFGTLHNHGLDELALRYLKHSTISFDSLFPLKTADKDKHFDMLPLEISAKYASEDSTVCMALYNIFKPKLIENQKLNDLYQTCDLPLLHVLFDMERNGVLVNKQKLQQLSNTFHIQSEKLSNEIFEYIGHEFNIGSPKQLSTVLFEELKLPANKKHSTDADALNDLIDSHPVIEKILNWRSVAKLASTYTDALPKQIASDNRIHTTYLQTSTNTGRISSRDPNLQNIPVKTDLGEEIRKCFIAPPNRKIISIDYSQIQLRLLTDVANIKSFKTTFEQGLDIHNQTAKKIFNIPDNNEIPRNLRRAAKTVNFSIIYGISSFGLANQLGISRTEAQSIINSYMTSLPEINTYIEHIKQFATDNACVYTLWGRKIELPEIKNPKTRSYAIRAAINAPIQGFEADIMRRAMINIYNKIILPNSSKIKLLMQVHDEMIFEADTNMAESFAKQIKYEMENITKLSVPLLAEYSIADYWTK